MISAATIRSQFPASTPPAFWRATSVRSFRDIAVTCTCEWAMTFAGKRVSGWAVAVRALACPHHGERVAR